MTKRSIILILGLILLGATFGLAYSVITPAQAKTAGTSDMDTISILKVNTDSTEVDDCCATDLEGEDAYDPTLVGGIPIPATVRDNLGITFATVERRSIASTRRIPGTFELRPDAIREYHALLGGRITLHVQQFDSVNEGDLLFTVNSPQWREIQHNAVEAEGEITLAESSLDVTQARLDEALTLVGQFDARISNLKNAGVRNASLEAEASVTRNSLPRLQAELRAQKARVKEAHEHYESRLKTLSTVTDIAIEELIKGQDGVAAWRSITELEVRANGKGKVNTLSVNNGGWLEAGALSLTTMDTTALRFHAEAPQSDIGLYKDGQPCRIVPPQGGTVSLQESISGELTLAMTAHPEDRTFSIYIQYLDQLAPWARSGVSAFLEVNIQADTEPTWSIPLSAVVQEGLESVFFRRDPDNPDRALRVLADLGKNDGRWVSVRSGLKKNDQVVLDGAYALKLTGSSQQAPEGYHFHADGALHKNH